MQAKSPDVTSLFYSERFPYLVLINMWYVQLLTHCVPLQYV